MGASVRVVSIRSDRLEASSAGPSAPHWRTCLKLGRCTRPEAARSNLALLDSAQVYPRIMDRRRPRRFQVSFPVIAPRTSSLIVKGFNSLHGLVVIKGARHSNPKLLKLSARSRPMTRWSWTLTPMAVAAATISRVMAMSAAEGLGSPLG